MKKSAEFNCSLRLRMLCVQVVLWLCPRPPELPGQHLLRAVRIRRFRSVWRCDQRCNGAGTRNHASLDRSGMMAMHHGSEESMEVKGFPSFLRVSGGGAETGGGVGIHSAFQVDRWCSQTLTSLFLRIFFPLSFWEQRQPSLGDDKKKTSLGEKDGPTPCGIAATVRPKSKACYNKRFFIYFIFYFRFLQKYIFDLEIYRNIPWQRGGWGISEKKFAEKISRRSLGAGRPAAGRPALAARLQGDRLSHPYIRVGRFPTLHLHH